MSTPASIMASEPNTDLIRRIIEARNAYESLCGQSPTCIHVELAMLGALAAKGFKVGAQIAGMKIVARIGAPADVAICSLDERLFEPPAPAPVVTKPARSKSK